MIPTILSCPVSTFGFTTFLCNLSYNFHLLEDGVGEVGGGGISPHVLGPDLTIGNDGIHSL